MSGELFIQQRRERRKKKKGQHKESNDVKASEEPLIAASPMSKGRKRKDAKVTLSNSTKTRKSGGGKKQKIDPYSHLDTETALAMRKDDAEIAALEAKLGLSNSREKKKLFKELKHEGYGDDFGEFLDGLDSMVGRLQSNGDESREGYDENSSTVLDDKSIEETSTGDSDDFDEDARSDDDPENEKDEAVPMASPAANSPEKDESEDDEVAHGASDDTMKLENLPDHNPDDTYGPAVGEDIYGNVVDNPSKPGKLSKYVPPHMRIESSTTAIDNAESLAPIKKALNNSFNRLSENTLVTVAQSIARIYASHPTGNVNSCIWENINNACIARSYLMTGLVPIYAAAVVGVHIQKGDSAHLGEYLIEMAVRNFDKELAHEREKKLCADDEEHASNQDTNDLEKRVFNLMLLLCYLYNFDVVHCNLIYDVIRELIKSFKEVDIELLLIILSHVGRSLRSDDPSALKEIVLDVQKRAYDSKHNSQQSSRVTYLVSAVVDLKNNKRRQQDVTFAEKTSQLRKVIGRIKTLVATNNGNVRSSDSSLRIRLKDILEAEGRGRWWRVGAAWEGNQHVSGETKDSSKSSSNDLRSPPAYIKEEQDMERKLLDLAAKYRMNTDTR